VTSDTLELRVDPAQVYERGFRDFNFFAGLCIPDIMLFPFPPFYVTLWSLAVKAIKEGREDKLYKIIRYAIGLPRGFAKTTFLKVLVCWLIAYEKITFLLIVCATEPLAYAFLSDVSTMLGSENMQSVYGIWEPAVDNAGEKKGSYRRRLVILKAIGAGTSIRGVNEENRRPDFLLCDDMQTKENDDSDTEREALFDWFVGTLLKVVDKFFSVVFYVGNMYSDRCILYRLKESPVWISLITGAILTDETSIWPELQSVEDLYEGFIHDESLGKANIWFAEIMNDPVESRSSLLKGPFPELALSVIPAPDASFVTVDPANFRNSSDDNVICSHHIIDGIGYINEMEGSIWNPRQTASNSIDMAIRTDATLIAVEAYAYQESLAFWTGEILRAENIKGIDVIPITRRLNKTKEQHIRNFISEIYSKHWYFLRDIDRIKFVYQATAYRVGRARNKDDYLDCPAMGIEVRNQFAHLMSVRRVPHAQKARVIGRNTPF
jgi:hypothetical protein